MKNLGLFLSLLLLGALSLSAKASADGLGSGSDFLPVEQAYQVTFQLDDNKLVADWLIAPGYYLYKDKFKLQAYQNGNPEPLAFSTPAGKVHYDEYLEKEVEIFYSNTQLTASIADLPREFVIKIQSQGCADAGLCYAPRSQYFEINRDFGTAVETSKPAAGGGGSGQLNTTQTLNNSGATGANQPTLFLAILLALGGGLILNLMPCVFPVLSLKALTFASSGGSDHSHHLHGWAYTAGVIGSFVLAALIIIAARAAGEQTGWGFQLQSPHFVAAIAYLFLFMGLSLSGFMQIGTHFMGIGQGLTAQSGYTGSFFTGVLAALVASPCTGPLMAPALGFALTQSAPVALAIFIALGFGMALPFLLLSYSPKLADLLPQPGSWMERLKELLAFPMYLTAVWLLFVYGRQVGMHGAAYLLCGALALVFAIWLFKHLPASKLPRLAVQVTSVFAVLFAFVVISKSEQFRTIDQNSPWQPYSAELVEELRKKGQPVFVDFTADWCITCKANERVALSRDEFFQAVKNNNYALVKGDWTSEDPKISKVLEQFNRSGVPLYLVYSATPGQAPEVLPQILTQSLVVSALERVAKGTSLASEP